jgi:hypothetical protein
VAGPCRLPLASVADSSLLAVVGGRGSSGVIVPRSNALAIELGAVFERYLSRRLLIRFDGGDVIAVFRSFVDNGERVTMPAHGVDSLQLACGFGWSSDPHLRCPTRQPRHVFDAPVSFH